MTKTNTLYKTYGHIHTMKERIKSTNKTNIQKDKVNNTHNSDQPFGQFGQMVECRLRSKWLWVRVPLQSLK